MSVTVPDGRSHLVIYGTAETIETGPLRAELTADVFARLAATDRPDPASLVPTLDEQQRTAIRVTLEKIPFVQWHSISLVGGLVTHHRPRSAGISPDRMAARNS